jgi:hypothetical protein
MAQGQSQHVVEELEDTVACLEQREKWLRAILSSAFTSLENRRDAREELESLLDKTDEVEGQLLLLESSDESGGHRTDSEERLHACRQARTILRRRFRKRRNRSSLPDAVV